MRRRGRRCRTPPRERSPSSDNPADVVPPASACLGRRGEGGGARRKRIRTASSAVGGGRHDAASTGVFLVDRDRKARQPVEEGQRLQITVLACLARDERSRRRWPGGVHRCDGLGCGGSRVTPPRLPRAQGPRYRPRAYLVSAAGELRSLTGRTAGASKVAARMRTSVFSMSRLKSCGARRRTFRPPGRWVWVDQHPFVMLASMVRQSSMRPRLISMSERQRRSFSNTTCAIVRRSRVHTSSSSAALRNGRLAWITCFRPVSTTVGRDL